MKTLKHIEIFQNGIKEEGMADILSSLECNPDLEVLRLNDNVIKNTCSILIKTIPSLLKLKVIDISDSILGHEQSIEVFKSLSSLPEIKEIYCNYNEVEKKSAQRAIMEICLNMKSLEVVQIKGNEIDPSVWKKFKRDLRKQVKSFDAYSDEEEVVSEEEEEEEITKGMEKLEIDK